MKFWNYAIISAGLAFLFELGGIPVASALLSVLGLTTTGIGIQSTTLWTTIIGISVGSSLLIGVLTRTSPENYIIWPIILLVSGAFLMPLVGIATAAKSYAGWIYTPILFLMGVLTVGYVISIYEHFRGSD